MKILVIQDTFVGGVPVFAGDQLVLNQTTVLPDGNVTVSNGDLVNLKLANRVVDLALATDEQLDLIDAREAARETKAAAANKAAALRAAKTATRKKSASQQTEVEGAK